MLLKPKRWWVIKRALKNWWCPTEQETNFTFPTILCWAVIYLREIHFSDVKINISGPSLLESIHYEYGEYGCERQGCQEEEWPWHGEEAQVSEAPLKVGVIFFFFLGSLLRLRTGLVRKEFQFTSPLLKLGNHSTYFTNCFTWMKLHFGILS